MGTVGLSFGSPTSGTGFDVSSTVAQIVSNLQNVETPWQNQLSSLESQDSAISNLGSLLSNVSNDISQLTDADGVLSEVEGSSSDSSVLDLTSASSSAEVGSYDVAVNLLATTANGYLDEIADASDTLSGSMTIQANGGSTYTFEIGAGTSSGDTIYTGSGEDTLADLESAINNADIGVTANVTTDANGSRLTLESSTSGADGSLNVSSSITDTTTGDSLGYNSITATGSNASLTVNGISYSVASNTVSGVIPGVTFDLLGVSSDDIQIVISNDNSAVESAVNQFVSDYNSLISAVNAQQGDTSSGTAEPLYGSPTLTLLQQDLLSGIDSENPNGYLNPVSADAGVTLSGSLTIQVSSGTAYTFEVGDGTSSGDTYYTGSGNDTLADLASAINSAGIGVTAAVSTSDGESTLALTSGTSGSNGALSVTSAIEASMPTALSYADSGATSTTTADSGTLGEAESSSDALSGSLTVQVGSSAAQTIEISAVDSAEGGDTLSDLESYINANSSTLGFSATLVNDSDGAVSLSLTSNTDGSGGALTVTSNLYDTTNSTSSTLSYTNSSDINSLTSLGISVNDDGSLSFDSSTLDSVLDSDYSSVVGFFQNIDSWGQNFSTMLTNAGTSSSTGMLALAESSISSTESTLNAEISNENSVISADQSSLTAELNSANEIMQELPSQLQGINELYSAITGYNENTDS